MAHSIRSVKWEFIVMVNGHEPVQTPVGLITPVKIVLIDRGGKCKIEASGPIRGGGGNPRLHRTAHFNMNGYPQHSSAPDWALDLLREASFAKTEV